MTTVTKIASTLFTTAVLFLVGCTKTETVTEFSNLPIGNTTVLKTGTITQQNAPGTPATSGMVSVIEDSKGTQFLRLSPTFTTGFSTGTVAIYFAKTNGEIKTQRSGGTTASNVRAIGFVNKAGEQFIPLNGTNLFTGFSFVIFYCETAEVNFGMSPLN